MSRKAFNLSEQEYFPPFELNGEEFDLSHLSAHTVCYVHKAPPNSPDKPDIEYTFYVTYSMHCFAKDYSHLTAQDRALLMYTADRESRPFCTTRYHLSRYLPDIIRNLPEEFTFHGGYDSYATCKVQDADGNEQEYYVSFSAYREKKKLRLHIMSAYPLDKPLGKRKKVNFFSIAHALLRNKRLPRP